MSVVADVLTELRGIHLSLSKFEERKGSLVSRDEWGEINFSSAYGDMEFLFWCSGQLQNGPVLVIGPSLEKILTCLQEFILQLEVIDRFQITIQEPIKERNNIVTNIKVIAEQVRSHSSILSLFLCYKNSIISDIQMEEFRNNEKELSQILSEAQEQKSRIDETAESLRESSSEIGASSFAAVFADEARRRSEVARVWLVVTVIMTILALWSGLVMVTSGGDIDSVGDALYRLGSRLIIMTILIYSVIWCGRIVLANYHLSSVNRHRATSLHTMLAFFQAASDESAKDAVVIEAAKAAFGQVSTGFLSRNVTETSGIFRPVELIRKSVSGGKVE